GGGPKRDGGGRPRGEGPETPRPGRGAPRGPICGAGGKLGFSVFWRGGGARGAPLLPTPGGAPPRAAPAPRCSGGAPHPWGGGGEVRGSGNKCGQDGQSGLWVSDWYPQIAGVADEITLVRSCWCDGVNHVGGVCQMNTGSILAGRPSLGSWVTYGLGSENQDL